LAHAVSARAADIGCGSGILPLLLAARLPQICLTGIERVPSLADAAQRTVVLNGLGDRIRIVAGDNRDRHIPGETGFDLCVSNPPYHVPGRGKPPADPVRAAATVSDTLSAEDLATAARRLLRARGTLVVSCRPAQLVDLMIACRHHGIEPKTLREVLPAPDRPASLLLMTAVAGGRPGGFSMSAPLVVRGKDGAYTEEVRGIYTTDGMDPARLMDGLVRTAGTGPSPSDVGGLR
jgi:tRNA1Val (adenine37-N6)-methyltransferase